MAIQVSPSAPDEGTPHPSPITFEEFLLQAGDGLMEWVDGEVLLMSPASADHQRLRDFLLTLLRLFVERHGLGEVFGAPFLMRLPTRPSGREPDLLFVAAEHADRVRDTYLDGPADLAVEIVSPESDERDRGEKFIEYEAAGLPEYWLLDALRKEALFYHLGADARYHLVPLDPDGVYRSAVLPGFWLNSAWLWQRPLPLLTEVARQVGV